MVEERSYWTEAVFVRSRGLIRSANVGMSNERQVRTLPTACLRFPQQRRSSVG